MIICLLYDKKFIKFNLKLLYPEEWSHFVLITSVNEKTAQNKFKFQYVTNSFPCTSQTYLSIVDNKNDNRIWIRIKE